MLKMDKNMHIDRCMS